jgi:hypothetical protein
LAATNQTTLAFERLRKGKEGNFAVFRDGKSFSAKETFKLSMRFLFVLVSS